MPQKAAALSWPPKSGGLGRLPGDFLARGLGRSYGDVCLTDGTLLDVTRMDRFLAFDPDRGVLRAQAGVCFADILRYCVPKGWFVPVTPGTKFVTLGGAIANDIHGKNHHRAGTFGRHVLRLEIMRSDGSRLVCSPTENAEMFRATIGGLGLTGLILWAEIQMKRIASSKMIVDRVKFGSLAAFLELDAASAISHEYTVAWIDGFARGTSLGRGVFIRGNHTPGPSGERDVDDARPPARRPAPSALRVPFDMPGVLLNAFTMRAFNAAYYAVHPAAAMGIREDFDPFFYPLDSIGHWNRLYGARGFYQYQCVVPRGAAGAVRGLLEVVSRSGQGSFLAVLKNFGDIPSPGLMSFPMPGTTLALDFPNRGSHTSDLLSRLDALVVKAGGRVYPAKDARMTASSFKRFYPQWKEFSEFIDPRFSSLFWKRVNALGGS